MYVTCFFPLFLVIMPKLPMTLLDFVTFFTLFDTYRGGQIDLHADEVQVSLPLISLVRTYKTSPELVVSIGPNLEILVACTIFCGGTLELDCNLCDALELRLLSTVPQELNVNAITITEANATTLLLLRKLNGYFRKAWLSKLLPSFSPKPTLLHTSSPNLQNTT